MALGPKESEVQRLICEWLDVSGFFFWRSNNVPVFSRNNGGKMAFRSLPKYTPRGIADILCIVNGTFVALEVKREGGSTTKERRESQQAFGNRVVSNGGRYYIVHSLEELRSLPEFSK